MANPLIFGKQESSLPTYETVTEIVNWFVDFFADKIKVIQEDITEKLKMCSNDKRRAFGNINPSEFLSIFTPATENKISKSKRSAKILWPRPHTIMATKSVSIQTAACYHSHCKCLLIIQWSATSTSIGTCDTIAEKGSVRSRDTKTF